MRDVLVGVGTGCIILVALFGGAFLFEAFFGGIEEQQAAPRYLDKPTIIFYGATPPKVYQGDLLQIDASGVLFKDAVTGNARIVSPPFEIIHHEPARETTPTYRPPSPNTRMAGQ